MHKYFIDKKKKKKKKINRIHKYPTQRLHGKSEEERT